MKTTNKVLSVLLSFVMLVSIFSATPVFAEEESAQFAYKELVDGTVEISFYSGTDTDLVVPSTLDGKTVTSIGSFTFFLGAPSVTRVTLPKTINNIDLNAFYYCKSLKSVRIENKDCNIYPSTSTIPNNVKIHGYKNSTAEAYAAANGNAFTAIIEASSSTVKVTLSASSYTYDGTAKKPSVTVKDTKGKAIDKSNYSISYSDNKNVGTAKVKVSFKEDYGGTINKTFKINPKNTSISSLSAQYKGFTVKWSKQATQTTGYQIQYSTDKNFKKGNKTVTVSKNSTVSTTVTKLTAKKKYYVRIRTYKTVSGTKYYSGWSGSKNVTASSYPTTISLSTTSYTYNGKAKKPSVTVKNNGTKIKSKYYTVSYPSGRKNVGQYTVTIKFKAPYSGTVKKTFTIKPKATTLSSVTAKPKGFTVKWKKLTTQTTGYQIQYSTSSNFSSAKTVTVSKNSTTSKIVSDLKALKKYYVRVRTYKTVKVNGKSTKLYSAWSSSKSVTTKYRADGVLKLVNKEREKVGLKKLTYRDDLQAAADKRAKEVASYFSHTRPNGTLCFTAIIEAGISYKSAGENIAVGQQTEEQVMIEWMDSPSHKANILNKNFTGMAVGCYEKDGVKYWVQLFVEPKNK